MSERILHVSDSLLSLEQYENEDASLGGISGVVDCATEQDVDAVVHSGNLFRRPEPAQGLVDTLGEELAELKSRDIPFLVVKGTREANTGGGLETLAERELAQLLTHSPTRIGDLAIYGIDHADSEEELLDQLDDLEPTSAYTYNLVAAHQRIWPPAQKPSADVTAFDFLEATEVHVDLVLAGGQDEPRDWEHDDYEYHVSYPGTTNPRENATGTLIRADTDGHTQERIPLFTTDVTEEIEHLRQALDFQPSAVEELDTETLVDIYGLAARAKSQFDKRRKTVRDELLERVEEDGRLEGQYASVNRRTQRRRSLKAEETVYAELENHGIDTDTVMTLDSSALRELVEEGELDEDDIFDITENSQVRLDDVFL